MKFNVSPLVVLALLTLTFSTSLFSHAADGRPFESAAQYSVKGTFLFDGQPDKSTKMILYVDGSKSRAEIATETGIVRPDLGRIYNVSASSRTYSERAYSPGSDPQKMFYPDGVWRADGKEVVNGVNADKYRLMTRDSGLLVYWVNPATKFPIRIALEKANMIVDFDSFKAGAQPASLFEPPAGFKKVSAKD